MRRFDSPVMRGLSGRLKKGNSRRFIDASLIDALFGAVGDNQIVEALRQVA